MDSSLTAQTIDRTTRPKSDPPPAVTFPEHEEFRLDNGLKVFLVRDSRPNFTMRMLIGGGASRDGDRPGLASAVADLLIKGAGEHTSQRFAEEIDFVGGRINGSASEDGISVSASGLKKHLGTILPLYRDVVMHPTYREEEIAKYQELLSSQLNASKKEAGFLAESGINKVIYGSDSPLGAMATEERIRAIERDAIQSYHSRWFTPNNASLAVVGDFTVEELREIIEEAFGSWEKKVGAIAMANPIPQLSGNRIILIDRPTSVQSAIRVIGSGFSITDPDRPKGFIMNSIFGGGTGLGNRLAMNLRETHGYTYTPYSYFTANAIRGHFVVAADVGNDVTDSALKEIFYELDRMRNETIDSEELRRNIQSSAGNYMMSLAEPRSTARRVQAVDFYGLPKEYYKQLVSVYNSVTEEKVKELANAYYDRNSMTVLIVGKASEIKEDLERFGAVEVWDENLEPIQESSADDIGMSAEEIWGKMVNARGGVEAMKKIQSLSSEGNIALTVGPQKLQGKFKQVNAFPNKNYVEISVMGMTAMQEFNDGENITLVQQGAKQVLEGNEKQERLIASHILFEAYYKDLGVSLTLKGKRKINDIEALVIEAAYGDGGINTYFIDPTTYLPVRIDSKEASVAVDTWGESDGVKLQTGMTISQGGVDIVISDLVYVVNGAVDTQIFNAE